MAFTGKATFTAGTTLPELAEDVGDIVDVISPHETPLLDALGDAARPARSTVHEWVEDSLLPNTDTINDATWVDPAADTQFVVANGSRFRVGDQVRPRGMTELLLVTGVSTNTLTVVRAYGGTTECELADGMVLEILGNAALEGEDAAAARFTSRTRGSNYTQIFTETVEVSGTDLAVGHVALADELDYQKTSRLREMLRNLESTVVGGTTPAANPEGSLTVRRTMKGLLQFVRTNVFVPGAGGFPADTALTEAQLNLALRTIWQGSAGRCDLIVVNGRDKRAINKFVGTQRRYTSEGDRFTDGLAVYESDFGVCRVILTRWVPSGTVLLLDSTRVQVKPLAGRSFHYTPLARTGDAERGQLVGEYTLECRQEAAHGSITGLTA